MEDIIDIIVTETTNLIEITSQSTDEVIDVNIIDNREDVTLSVTPTVVEININSLTGNFGVAWGEITGTLSSQTDLNTALGLKADLVGGKVPSSQLPSYVDDVVEVANYAALPATGETGKIYVVLDTNKIYRWTGSAYIEIVDSTAVWGAITGTLSSQTDLQTALNAKFNNPTGDSTQYLNGAGTPTTFPIAGQAGTLVREVRNTTGATLTKGTIVYISGATGNKPTVSKAIATGDSTSAQTFGMCQADIANNANGYVVCTGDLSGLDTSGLTEGAQLYLSSTTAGTYTTTKQVAPAHLVYIGVVTRAHPTQGQIEVKIQNGYELDEIHDVLITSKANNDGLFYESSTSLWKNKSIATVLGYSPEQPLTFNSPLSRSTNAVSIPAATSSVNGYLTSADWITFNAKQSALSFSGPLVLSGSTVYILTASSAQNGYLSAADWITFNSKQAALSGTGFVKISGTTISYDSSTYVDNANNQSIAGVKTFTTSVHASGLRFSESGGFGNVAGFTQIGGTADYFNFVNGTNTKSATFTYPSGGYTYALPASSGTIVLTSNLSSYLPLSGGTLTGALSGTSASFSSSVQTTNIGINFAPQTDRLFVYNGSGTNTLITAQQDGTGDLIRLNGNSGTNRFVVQQGGNVGIGTTSPGEKLWVNLATNVNFAVGGSTRTRLLGVNDANNNFCDLSVEGSNVLFYSAGAERMRITSGGNVGIGTTSPTNFGLSTLRNLQIVGSTHGVVTATAGSVNAWLIADTSEAATGTESNHPFKITTNNTERMRFDTGGNAIHKAYSVGQGILMNFNGGATYGFYNNNAGALTLTNSGVANVGVFNMTTGVYTPTSDINKKKDFEDSSIGLKEVLQLKPTLYRMKTESENTEKQLGFIAQEVKGIIPSAYQESGDFIGLNFNPIVAAHTSAIQELNAKIVILEAEIQTLKNK